MAKKAKRLTKRERRAQGTPRVQAPVASQSAHIHCVACGRHMEPEEFDGVLATARHIVCDHGGRFPACGGCEVRARELVAEHDRLGQPVRAAAAWH